MVDDTEVKETQEFMEFIRKWAAKKMRKLEKKIRFYAEVYFGEPIVIIYAKKDAMKIVDHRNEPEGDVLDEVGPVSE